MLIEERISCPHTIRRLHAAGITTMEQLSGYTFDDLMKLRGVGKVIAGSVSEIIADFRPDDVPPRTAEAVRPPQR